MIWYTNDNIEIANPESEDWIGKLVSPAVLDSFCSILFRLSSNQWRQWRQQSLSWQVLLPCSIWFQPDLWYSGLRRDFDFLLEHFSSQFFSSFGLAILWSGWNLKKEDRLSTQRLSAWIYKTILYLVGLSIQLLLLTFAAWVKTWTHSKECIASSAFYWPTPFASILPTEFFTHIRACTSTISFTTASTSMCHLWLQMRFLPWNISLHTLFLSSFQCRYLNQIPFLSSFQLLLFLSPMSWFTPPNWASCPRDTFQNAS